MSATTNIPSTKTTGRKYLITGGAGFIGTHLSEHLLNLGHEVTVLDNFATGSPNNVERFRDHAQFHFVEGSVENCQDLPELVSEADWVFHLAAAVGVDVVVREPVNTIQTNIHGSERIFELCSRFDTPVLVTSTSEVYGRAASESFAESDDLLIGPPTHYRWSYAASKALDEFMAIGYQKEKGLQPIVTRLFNTIGPRQVGTYGMVVPRFIEAALQNRPLRVFGTGEQTRCFCHVTDTVKALYKLHDSPEAIGEILNIGSQKSISIETLAKRIIELTRSRSTIEYVPYEEAYAPGFEDMLHRKPDTSKIQAMINWVPEKTLDETIKEIASYIGTLETDQS